MAKINQIASTKSRAIVLTNGLLSHPDAKTAHGLIRVPLPLQYTPPPNSSRRFSPSSPFVPEKIIRISSGNHHCLALSNYGKVYAWGMNDFG